jgi:hypothetical protein
MSCFDHFTLEDDPSSPGHKYSVYNLARFMFSHKDPDSSKWHAQKWAKIAIERISEFAEKEKENLCHVP